MQFHYGGFVMGMLLSVFALSGAIAGIILNSFPSVFSWEMATLIETGICLVIFYGSGLQTFKNEDYLNRVRTLFERLHTKITNVPSIDKNFNRALSVLYIASLVVSGILFIGMGIPSLNELSGALAVASGIACLIIGGIIWMFSRNIIKGK